MARPQVPDPGLPRAGVRRRRRRVRGARLRRRERRPHRPRRPPQQGDDLLPLQEQGRALPRDPARHVRRRPDRGSAAVAALARRRRRTSCRAYVAAIADEAEARPHFPPIWLREIAEGAGHVDAVDARLRPRRARRARRDSSRRRPRRPLPADHRALLVQGGIIAPLDVLPRDRAAAQEDRARGGADGIADLSRDMVVAHIQRLDARSTGREDRTTRRPTLFSRSRRPQVLRLRIVVISCAAVGPWQPLNRGAGRVDPRHRLRRSDRGAGRRRGRRTASSTSSVAEGDRVVAGDVIARIDTSDVDLALQRARRRDRDQARGAARAACAPARGRRTSARRRRRCSRRRRTSRPPRPSSTRRPPTSRASRTCSAPTPGSRQAARRCGDAAGRGGGARSAARRIARRPRPRPWRRLRAGARPQEVDAARARVSSADAQIASLRKNAGRRRGDGAGRRAS